MTRKYCHLTLLMALTCLLAACGQMSAGLKDAKALQDTVQEAYPDVDKVSITLQNASSISVTLRDNELYNAPHAAHQQQADAIGRMAAHIFKDKPGYTQGTVVYETVETTGVLTNKQRASYDMHLRE